MQDIDVNSAKKENRRRRRVKRERERESTEGETVHRVFCLSFSESVTRQVCADLVIMLNLLDPLSYVFRPIL